jgi:hypothetical protein
MFRDCVKLVVYCSFFSFLAAGCSPTKVVDSAFHNKLALGTGLNPANLFQLSGETSTFTGAPATITFRLESQDDMAGSSVTISIKKKSGSTYVADTSWSYPNPQNYGHIFLSTFIIPVTGSYEATGILVTGNKPIASTQFTVQ